MGDQDVLHDILRSLGRQEATLDAIQSDVARLTLRLDAMEFRLRTLELRVMVIAVIVGLAGGLVSPIFASLVKGLV